jgi:hypothetical protein
MDVDPQNYHSLTYPERKQLRLRYVEAQGGNCRFCKAPLAGPPPAWVKRKRINWDLFPEGFLRWPVHLHHDHQTGMTIGAVHALCNAVLWCYHGE